jgi:hypothetical protein
VVARPIRPLAAASRAALAPAAASAVIALAACGSVVAGGHPASAGAPAATAVPGGNASAGVALCLDLPRLTSVVVIRPVALRAIEPGLLLPRGITIREPLLVRGLARALCGLPKVPRGLVNCPAQVTGSLRLVFAAGGRAFRPVTVQLSGCRVVTGVGSARSVPSVVLWRILGKDLGVKFPQPTRPSSGINP